MDNEKVQVVRHHSWLAAAACLFAIHGGTTIVAAQDPVFHRLKFEVPGKLQAVTWSAQRNALIVQIDFPSVRNGEPEPAHARTNVWLLKPDGMVPLVSRSPESPAIGLSKSGWVTYFVTFAFPRSAETESVAIVLQVDDQFFVERLLP